MSYTSFHLSALRRPVFGLALLTCAGLAAAPGYAQAELDLGVSGTTVSGTATVTENGATASGTYTYNDGGTGTSLNEQKSFSGLFAYGNSTLNLTGGNIVYFQDAYGYENGYVGGYDASTVNVSGGTINGFLDIYNTSVLNFSGGSVSASLDALGASTANISGGFINDLETYDASTANISGGNINTFEVYPASIANISGGSINEYLAVGRDYLDFGGTSIANISGGSFANLTTYESGTINLFGTGLAETYLGYDPAYQAYAYSLTGTLQNGDALNAHYYDYGGTLVLNPVPEASSVMSLGILLVLGLGGLAVSARRKAQAAA